MGFWWDLEGVCSTVISIIVTGILYCYCVKPFLQEKKYLWLAGVSYIFMLFVLYFGYPIFHIDGLLAEMIGVFVMSSVLCFFDRHNLYQKIFLAIVMCLANPISDGILAVGERVLRAVLIQSAHGRPVRQFVFFVLYDILDGILNIVVMVYLFRLVDRLYVYKNSMGKRELGLLLATPLLALLGNLAFHFFSRVYESDTGTYIWNIHREYDGFFILYELLSFAAVIIALCAYQEIKKAGRQEKENARLSEQVASTKRHIEEIERLYQEAGRLRHDMGNHIMTLENLLLRNETEESAKYLLHLKEQLKEITPEIRSGNPVTDVILYERQKEAKRQQIRFDCDFQYPRETSVNAFDISVILNNALANAMEAAEGKKDAFISVVSYRNKNAYIIEIRNCFEGTLALDKISGLPLTTKPDKENHGFGLTNIRKIARKYSGEISIEQEGNVFLLSIMLLLADAAG